MSIIIVLTEGSAIIYIEIDRVFLKQRIKRLVSPAHASVRCLRAVVGAAVGPYKVGS